MPPRALAAERFLGQPLSRVHRCCNSLDFRLDCKRTVDPSVGAGMARTIEPVLRGSLPRLHSLK